MKNIKIFTLKYVYTADLKCLYNEVKRAQFSSFKKIFGFDFFLWFIRTHDNLYVPRTENDIFQCPTANYSV